ncbi:hypothetical protein KR222_000984, partial [Zaprionus bogoriensis]
MLLILIQLEAMQAIWFPWYFQRYGLEPHSSRHSGAMKSDSTSKSKGKGNCPPGYELKGAKAVPPGASTAPTMRMCDDNPVVMQLARLYVVSPERIVLLLAQPQLMESCDEIADVLTHIASFTSDCVLAEDNIYAKLTNGLHYYKSEMCDGGSSNKKRCVGLAEAHSCLKELRTDMIECEAAADWYEKRNHTQVCKTFNDVLDCYYIRAAMLCGLPAAKQLRSFAADSMKKAMLKPCAVRKRLPRVKDPMILLAGHTLHRRWVG